MKSLTIFILLLFCFKIYSLEILTKDALSDRVWLEFKNKNSKPILIFTGSIGSKYKIVDENNNEITGRSYSTWDPEYTIPEFSEDLIRRTEIRYGIERPLARKWLEIKKEYFVLQPKQSKKIMIDFDVDTYNYAYKIIQNKKYYVAVETNFYTEFVPKKFIDSIKSKNVNFIENPRIKYKLLIDKDNFFQKKCFDEDCYYIK